MLAHQGLVETVNEFLRLVARRPLPGREENLAGIQGIAKQNRELILRALEASLFEISADVFQGPIRLGGQAEGLPHEGGVLVGYNQRTPLVVVSDNAYERGARAASLTAS